MPATAFDYSIIPIAKSLYARMSMFNKISWKGSDSGQSIKQSKIPVSLDKNTNEYIIAATAAFSNQTTNSVDTFENKTLDGLRVSNNIGPFDDGHWEAKLNEEGGRLYIYDAGVSDSSMLHPVFSSVYFKDVIITFDIDGVEKKIYLDKASSNYEEIESKATVRQVGFNGKLSNAADRTYHIGISQSDNYLIKCQDSLIHLVVEYSFVFRYPRNDFDPTGLIDACKIYPQICFSFQKTNLHDINFTNIDPSMIIDPPPGKDGNLIKIKKFNARIKFTCNNNSTHHINIVNGYDTNLFPTLRASGHLPDMFEHQFISGRENWNTVGTYTDSNMGTLNTDGPDDERDRPGYKFTPTFNKSVGNYKIYVSAYQPSPFWANIFDYGTYNLRDEIEFLAVRGMQDPKYHPDTHSFDKTINQIDPNYQYLYPPNQFNKKITINKEERQAAFDNIHLHGYFGQYKDNQQIVIHAPICGYCCFHLHWRWSGLNATIAGNPVIQFAANDNDLFSAFVADGDQFRGWYNHGNNGLTEPHARGGLSLIPYEQQLKISITRPDAIPATEDGDITPTNKSDLGLDHLEKSIWYCVDIVNTNDGIDAESFGFYKSHLVLEQGCGYAYRYSENAAAFQENSYFFSVAKLFREICEDYLLITDSVFLDYVYNSNTHDSSLSTHEFYEVQYRLMRFFNEPVPNTPSGRKDYNQIPGLNEQPSNSNDKNTYQYLISIWDSIVKQ